LTQTIYAIGDIHGHLDQLKRVHALIDQDQIAQGIKGAKVVHIGDLTDRGRNSRGVIEHLLNGRASGKNWTVIKGNHDRLFQKFVDEPSWVDHRLRSDYNWLHPRMGGQETLASYGINATAERSWLDLATEARDTVPATHIDFLRDLPLYHQHDDLLFVHAGIRPDVEIGDQDKDDLMWIRAGFLDHTASFGPLVVHGHTMVHTVENHGNRLNIDTGAGRGDALSGVVIEGRQIWVLEPQGRRLLSPQTPA
jgi:serine/threonine protein phosphatase 1